MEREVDFLESEHWDMCWDVLTAGELMELDHSVGEIPTPYREFLRTVHGKEMPDGYVTRVDNGRGRLEYDTVGFLSGRRREPSAAGAAHTILWNREEAHEGFLKNYIPIGQGASGSIFVLEPSSGAVMQSLLSERKLLHVSADFSGFMNTFEFVDPLDLIEGTSP